MREYETETFERETLHTQICSTPQNTGHLQQIYVYVLVYAALMTNRQQKHHRELNSPKIMHSYHFTERNLFTYKTMVYSILTEWQTQ